MLTIFLSIFPFRIHIRAVVVDEHTEQRARNEMLQ